MNCNRFSFAQEISDRIDQFSKFSGRIRNGSVFDGEGKKLDSSALAATTFLDESQLLIFGGRQGRNDYVNSCTLQQTNVVWKPILPSWARYYRKANSLSFYPVRIHKRSSQKLAVLRLQQPLILRLTR